MGRLRQAEAAGSPRDTGARIITTEFKISGWVECGRCTSALVNSDMHRKVGVRRARESPACRQRSGVLLNVASACLISEEKRSRPPSELRAGTATCTDPRAA